MIYVEVYSVYFTIYDRQTPAHPDKALRSLETKNFHQNFPPTRHQLTHHEQKKTFSSLLSLHHTHVYLSFYSMKMESLFIYRETDKEKDNNSILGVQHKTKINCHEKMT